MKNKGAMLVSFVLGNLPDSIKSRKLLLADLDEVLPNGDPKRHVRVVMAQMKETERVIRLSQEELDLQFSPPNPTHNGGPQQ